MFLFIQYKVAICIHFERALFNPIAFQQKIGFDNKLDNPTNRLAR